jgi:hypothetical protein
MLSPGQGFTVLVQAPSEQAAIYYVRCLPANFPSWTAKILGKRYAEWHFLAPVLKADDVVVPGRYSAVFDSDGVPLWWSSEEPDTPFDFKLLPNGNTVLTMLSGAVIERRLDGSVVRRVAGGIEAGGKLDTHDVQQLLNGNLLIARKRPLCCEDLRAFGGPAAAAIDDSVIQEVAPDGKVVWRWSARDHIGLSEFQSQFWPSVVERAKPNYDLYHWNSVDIEADGDLIVSYRHLNAVYKIRRASTRGASGSIVWKLGGSVRPESLKLKGDAVARFGGQHDARMMPDRTLTVFDNGTGQARPPRAVRYAIDPVARSATLVEQLVSPGIGTSLCCGSARKISGADWVIGWGDQKAVAEITPSGTRVFALTFGDGVFSYRDNPVAIGRLPRAALRAGMDARHPR